ncbi:MAG: hypothetical protein FWG84_08775 [Bacteroidales bacterium]|nr:hypothetical protein [Bacteroidales bacterium]
MSGKSYKTSNNVPLTVGEAAVAYETALPEVSSSDRWNPNVPFHGTQEEWWEHFHRIEEGNFTPLEEANREFEIWRKKYLASRLK